MKKADFKVGDRARVVLGSSVDKDRGDVVVIEGVYMYKGKERADCIVEETGHKFWCYYIDLMSV